MDGTALNGDDDASCSEDEDKNPLGPTELQAPLRSMLQAVDASPARPLSGVSPLSGSDVRRTKGRYDESAEQLRMMRRLLPFDRGAFSQNFLDPARLGLCTETEAQRLFDMCVRACLELTLGFLDSPISICPCLTGMIRMIRESEHGSY